MSTVSDSDFRSTRYTGFEALKNVLDARCDELLSKGGDGDQYMAFDHVSQETFGKIEENRLQLSMKAALSYYPGVQTLIVKIPTRLHEKAHHRLGQMIQMRTVAAMNLDINDFSPMGSATKKAPNGSSKESDSSWKNENLRPRDGDFPCLVVEAGMSESLSLLRQDAHWWIENSGGKVNMVLIISIRKSTRVLHIEKYIPGPAQTRTSPRHPRPPFTKLEGTIMIDSAASPSTVTGAPLVLEFSRIFDRSPSPPLEQDVVFTMQDLQTLGDKFWS